MPMLEWMDPALAGLLGLVIGSFLNVVIYRLPRILEAQWARECADLQGETAGQPAPSFNLMTPGSQCQACGHRIRWYENIPVLSFLFLRGHCSACGQSISWRYPLVEAVSAGLFAFCIHRWGLTPTAALWCLFSSMLLAAALIDWDTTLLPDNLTLPLMWAGLIGAALGWTGVHLPDALWGAVGGYMSLWTVYWGFKLLTGKEGMGFGDFKLFAALGAWFGWQALVPIILMSSVIGALIGIGMKFTSGLREGGYIPFGPFLAGAGFAALFWGADHVQHGLLGLMGL
ncbi:MAG: prepilin peptidase [Curvibacter sp.]|nr:prepilin peptidase [Curvibacter sp.]